MIFDPVQDRLRRQLSDRKLLRKQVPQFSSWFLLFLFTTFESVFSFCVVVDWELELSANFRSIRFHIFQSFDRIAAFLIQLIFFPFIMLHIISSENWRACNRG